ncbi:hypothetical protein DB88DRAFT_372978 [Papiliotrema laurentii]|uniref:Uncharacterized protein n=1 Tax=Papiliotrema laurentii TaxID=5418 RepID=A0AAD9CTL8_PAPLA|nr:hypothetical protein DB88DRAFT_372978 [Papiliotrema laurentii]
MERSLANAVDISWSRYPWSTCPGSLNHRGACGERDPGGYSYTELACGQRGSLADCSFATAPRGVSLSYWARDTSTCVCREASPPRYSQTDLSYERRDAFCGHGSTFRSPIESHRRNVPYTIVPGERVPSLLCLSSCPAEHQLGHPRLDPQSPTNEACLGVVNLNCPLPPPCSVVSPAAISQRGPSPYGSLAEHLVSGDRTLHRWSLVPFR